MKTSHKIFTVAIFILTAAAFVTLSMIAHPDGGCGIEDPAPEPELTES